MEKSLAELKAIAAELGITPDGDKRQKDTWIRAIHDRGIAECEPTPQPQPETEEPPTEPWPFPSKEEEEEFFPKFHDIFVDEIGNIRYRYKIESYKSDWIRWTGTKKELLDALADIEASLDGTFIYKGHRIQVTPLLEINHKSSTSDWLKFPLSENEDIQEGIARLTSWIDSLSEAEETINNLPENSPLIKAVITAKITEHGMTEFRRNCTPVAVLTRPP